MSLYHLITRDENKESWLLKLDRTTTSCWLHESRPCSFMAHEDVLVGLIQLWKVWSIQGFMILSLAMQLVLALTAPLKKKTSNSAVILIVWLAYFLAKSTAIFAFGLISNARCKSSIDGTTDILVLWASFLLIHLGGPDTINTFSLEDNALWIRYLVGLIIKVFVFLYIFIKMLPDKRLMAPTLLVFATGFKRIRALYLTSVKNFNDTSIKFQATSLKILRSYPII